MSGNSVVYYIADIYLRSIDYMRTAISEHGYQSVAALAAANDAILAINGDYSLARELGPIVRDGMLFRDNSFGDVLVLYRSGEMKTFSSVDGGQSSVMVWNGGSMTVNSPANGGRPVSDIIYIPKE